MFDFPYSYSEYQSRYGADDSYSPRLTCPLRWYGGEGHLKNWLRAYIPRHRQTYVDVFGGGATATLMLRPCPQEIYADVDPGPCHFFTTLRDRPTGLQEAVKAIGASRQDFYSSLDWEATADPLMRAAKFFVYFRGSYSGESAKIGHQRSYGFAQRNMVHREKALKGYWRAVDHFPHFATRLRDISIQNLSFEESLSRYDSPDALLYNDPPYPKSMRTDRGQSCYRYEMDDHDHERLLRGLLACRGMVVISSYDWCFLHSRRNDMYCDYLKDWVRAREAIVSHAARWSVSSLRERHREEVLWLNPACWDTLQRYGADDPAHLVRKSPFSKRYFRN